ncbi:MAG: NDP-sugar synthase [Candidatus Thermoplasmatota archaeon]|nr:NDP-sugar synthase [Candidatus Thermoplasmatota archaeon]
MKAVILAGGVGTRLKPLTDNRPKPLVLVGDKMCIEYVMSALSKAGFNKMIITTGYMSDRLITTIGDGGKHDAAVLYSFEGTPAGTAGAVKKVGDYLDATFVVASGDVLADVDISALYRFHKEKKALVTIALTRVEDPTEFGVVGLSDDGRIERFLEKPKREEAFSDLINAGIYIMEPKVLDYIPDGEKYDFSKQVFPALLEKGERLYGMEIPGVWRDIGRPRDLLMASLDVIQRKKDAGNGFLDDGKVSLGANVEITGNVYFGKDVRIGPRVKITGPAYIGDGVKIGRDSSIERSCIHSGVRVDRDSRIVESIVLPGSQVGWRNEIEGTVVGHNCQVEDDVKLTNTILGDDTLVNKHSIIFEANISTKP